jgi:hypothetical protein
LALPVLAPCFVGLRCANPTYNFNMSINASREIFSVNVLASEISLKSIGLVGYGAICMTLIQNEKQCLFWIYFQEFTDLR